MNLSNQNLESGSFSTTPKEASFRPRLLVSSAAEKSTSLHRHPTNTARLLLPCDSAPRPNRIGGEQSFHFVNVALTIIWA
jgi:hypothetical protein